MREDSVYKLFTRKLDTLQLPYFVTGSVAVAIYGEPRLTHDVDLVVVLDRHDAEQFANAFPLEEFYCPPVEVIRIEAARSFRGSFNLIHHDTGFKADIYLCGKDPLHAWALKHARSVDVEGDRLVIAPPEYVVIRKLEYFREGRSDKHLRDIASILGTMPEVRDSTQVAKWVQERGLGEVWAEALNSDTPD